MPEGKCCTSVLELYALVTHTRYICTSEAVEVMTSKKPRVTTQISLRNILYTRPQVHVLLCTPVYTCTYFSRGGGETVRSFVKRSGTLVYVTQTIQN